VTTSINTTGGSAMTANRRHPAQRVLVLLAIALLLASAAALMAGTPASAGTYVMNQCQAATSRTVNSQWSASDEVGWFNKCGTDGNFGFAGGPTKYNTVAGASLTVPAAHPNVTISHVDANVTTAAEHVNADPPCCVNQYSFFWWLGSGQNVFSQEMTGWSQPIARDIPAGTRVFEMDIYCTYANNDQSCSWWSYPIVSIDRMTVTLQENVPPSAQATGGSLLTGGTLSGTQTLSYSATDADSGVHDVSVQLGKTTVATDHYGDRCANDDWNACPSRQDRAEMPIDTDQVADGTYPVTLVVTDAAGNTATVDTGRTVTVSNPHASGPGARKKSSSVQLVMGQGQTRALRTRYGRKLVLTGQALGSDGHPIANAQIDVSSQTAQPGQDFADLGKTQTDTNGAFAFSVPPGPNRTLRFSYTSPVAAGQRARAQTDVVVQSRATAQLKVSAHKVAGGRRVTFRGQLSGGPFPSGGVPIGFRGKVGKHTRKFADTQTDGQGRFHLTYKFGSVGPRKATYPIWVRIAADGNDYPYLPGQSNRVRITVVR
jgi:hypothetical protein